MNIAAPLSMVIFAITVLTLFGGLFAYFIYKARERSRPARGTGSAATDCAGAVSVTVRAVLLNRRHRRPHMLHSVTPWATRIGVWDV